MVVTRGPVDFEPIYQRMNARALERGVMRKPYEDEQLNTMQLRVMATMVQVKEAPSIRGLARMSGLRQDSIWEAVQQLAEIGLVTLEKGPRRLGCKVRINKEQYGG